jgi:hypothetical protein
MATLIGFIVVRSLQMHHVTGPKGPRREKVARQKQEAWRRSSRMPIMRWRNSRRGLPEPDADSGGFR